MVPKAVAAGPDSGSGDGVRRGGRSCRVAELADAPAPEDGETGVAVFAASRRGAKRAHAACAARAVAARPGAASPRAPPCRRPPPPPPPPPPRRHWRLFHCRPPPLWRRLLLRPLR